MSLSSNCEHREDLSDCADSQADLSLRPVQKMPFCLFCFHGGGSFILRNNNIILPRFGTPINILVDQTVLCYAFS